VCFVIKDWIMIEIIIEKLGMVLIEDKIREIRFKYFDHIKTRDTNIPVWGCKMMF